MPSSSDRGPSNLAIRSCTSITSSVVTGCVRSTPTACSVHSRPHSHRWKVNRVTCERKLDTAASLRLRPQEQRGASGSFFGLCIDVISVWYWDEARFGACYSSGNDL